MNINIDVIDERLIHFKAADLQTGMDEPVPATIGVVYDIEPGEPGVWLLYIDIQYRQEAVVHIETRSCFSIAAPIEGLWAKGVAEAYIKRALTVTRLSLQQHLPEHLKESEEFAAMDNEQSVEIVYNMLLEDVAVNQLYTGEDTSLYEGKLTFEPGNNYNLICGITLCVFDEIFYLNPNFDHEKNLKTFEQYLPLRYYITVKLKLMHLMNNEVIDLNIKQLTIFLFMVRCSCSLLLTEHFDNLWPGLEAKGATQPAIDNYIKAASRFLDDIYASLKEANVSILNLEDEIDWVALVS